jgi:hypothetical protein
MHGEDSTARQKQLVTRDRGRLVVSIIVPESTYVYRVLDTACVDAGHRVPVHTVLRTYHVVM